MGEDFTDFELSIKPTTIAPCNQILLEIATYKSIKYLASFEFYYKLCCKRFHQLFFRLITKKLGLASSEGFVIFFPII